MRVRLEGKQYVEHYVHSLTHEMKGPLAAIRSSAELLEAPLPDADRVRFADSIRIQSERLAQMIDKLLALAAVEHRQRIEQPAPVELVALATEVAELCTAGITAAGVELELRLDAVAPVRGDAFLLRQALANLVDNAIEIGRAHV